MLYICTRSLRYFPSAITNEGVSFFDMLFTARSVCNVSYVWRHKFETCRGKRIKIRFLRLDGDSFQCARNRKPRCCYRSRYTRVTNSAPVDVVFSLVFGPYTVFNNIVRSENELEGRITKRKRFIRNVLSCYDAARQRLLSVFGRHTVRDQKNADFQERAVTHGTRKKTRVYGTVLRTRRNIDRGSRDLVPDALRPAVGAKNVR